jgi:phosphoglycerate kinase
MELRTLEQLDLKNRRVFVRADLNVPLDYSASGIPHIRDTTRLNALLPTLNYLRAQNCKITVGTHLGRPFSTPKHSIDDPLSTHVLADWLNTAGYRTQLIPDLKMAAHASHHFDETIIMLENLRFFKGEQEASHDFAKLLAACAEVYVNDGFSVMHRADASITQLPRILSQRGCGLRAAEELAHLEHLIHQVAQPFIVIVGGNKITDKLPLLKGLLKKDPTERVASIIVGGALAFPLRAARGEKIIMPVQPIDLDYAHRIISLAKQNNVEIILPVDEIMEHDQSVDIGPQSVKLFLEKLAPAQTIFCNGTMGIYETDSGAHGTLELMRGIATLTSYRVIGGGNAVDAAHRAGIADTINFISTGGGATLQFLAAQNPYHDLPGLSSLI